MDRPPRGKIGLLPQTLLEQVNRHLEKHEKSHSIVTWLNSLPEVQTLMSGQFEGIPISDQNLSQWRHHGYKTWLWQREARDRVAQSAAHPGPGEPPLTDQMTDWLSVRYLLVVRELVENKVPNSPCRARRQECSPASNLQVLRNFARDLVALRRGDHAAARLKLARDRLARSGAPVSDPARLKSGNPPTVNPK